MEGLLRTMRACAKGRSATTLGLSPCYFLVFRRVPKLRGRRRSLRVERIRAARRLAADTQCLVSTVSGDEKNVLGAIEAGARGYLLKDASVLAGSCARLNARNREYGM